MIVAGRYAKSLMDIATETNKVEAVRADMKSVESLCRSNHDFELFLQSPVIKTDKKIEVLNSVFGGKVSDVSLSFLALVTKHGRESIISHIAAAFDEQYKKDRNIFTAVVTSANGIDAATRQKMLDLLKTQLNGEVELVEKTDASVIGGFILKMGDNQIDRSVSRQLSDIKKQLTNKALN